MSKTNISASVGSVQSFRADLEVYIREALGIVRDVTTANEFRLANHDRRTQFKQRARDLELNFVEEAQEAQERVLQARRQEEFARQQEFKSGLERQT